MHNHIGLKFTFASFSGCAHEEMVIPIFNGFHLGAELNINPELACLSYKLVNEVRVKVLKGAFATVQDCCFRSTTNRDMFKFKRNVAPSYKDDSSGQRIEFQELFACGQVLLARNVE